MEGMITSFFLLQSLCRSISTQNRTVMKTKLNGRTIKISAHLWKFLILLIRQASNDRPFMNDVQYSNRKCITAKKEPLLYLSCMKQIFSIQITYHTYVNQRVHAEGIHKGCEITCPLIGFLQPCFLIQPSSCQYLAERCGQMLRRILQIPYGQIGNTKTRHVPIEQQEECFAQAELRTRFIEIYNHLNMMTCTEKTI
ncbi:unnamed protein product [Albugo candida]|uniref:Uncharacterized protein n=1 Tax=Albugo candida TaxID=65357 RepID=A0A024FX91_9STRA|nr:unnamed protein product [Albugo candida]|eukprot:CCI11284.1 unnamed protein product [Albugo candida]